MTPVLVIRQASHVPAQPLVQQTLSAQKPLLHWVPPEQPAPSARFGEQVCEVRSQNDPVAHALSVVHDEGKQAVPPLWHATPPGQGPVLGVPGTQAPAPSQVAGVTVSCPFEQEDEPGHEVELLASAHLRLPSQKPVVPQAVAPTAQSLSALVPLGSGLQTPFGLPVLLPTHDSQTPAQSLSQQT